MVRRVDWWHVLTAALFLVGGPLAWWGIIAGIVALVKLIVR